MEIKQDTNSQLIIMAKSWLKDCFPEAVDEIDDLTDDDVIRSVNRYYEGRWEAFVKACDI